MSLLKLGDFFMKHGRWGSSKKNFVKIEKCFIDELGAGEEKPDDGAMVRAMVAMAHTLKLRAIAGGVENARQLELLAAMGCDAAFGYHLGRAMAPEGVEALLESGYLQTQNL